MGSDVLVDCHGRGFHRGDVADRTEYRDSAVLIGRGFDKIRVLIFIMLGIDLCFLRQ